MPRDDIFVCDLFSAQECRTIVEQMDKSCDKLSPSILAGTGSDKPGTKVYDRTNRFTYISGIPDVQDVYPFFERVSQKVGEFYSTDIEWWETPSFKIYPTGGHFSLHSDSILGPDGKRFKFNDRDYTIIIFLNDDYVGGELVFPDLKVEVKPVTGRLVCFPPDLRFMHKVNTVTEGTRYQLLTWMTARGTKREHDVSVHGKFLPRVDRKTWELL